MSTNRPSTALRLPALDPKDVPTRTASIYPTEELRAIVAGRSKQALGDALGLQTFGVNLTRLAPGAASSIRHYHTRQDEFIYVIEGEVTLVTDGGEQVLGPGACAGFPAGVADGHQLVNCGEAPTVFLEVGDRLPGDQAFYPGRDLAVRATKAGYEFVDRSGKPLPVSQK